MNNLTNIKLDMSAVTPLLTMKLVQYAEILDLMDANNGWFPFSDTVLKYFDKLGVIHWAELYFPEGSQKLVEEWKDEVGKFNQMIINEIGDNPTLHSAETFLNTFAKNIAELEEVVPGLEFLESQPNATLIEGIPDDERRLQRDTLLGFLVNFYNDLSIAAHRESLFSLVKKAKENNDSDSLVKAIQIDPSIIKFFEKILLNHQMKGNANFFDSFAYRIKNSPRRGNNKHPLLWILMKDLYSLRCLHKGTTSKKILDLYQSITQVYPKLQIDDEQIVQRQRRKFNQLYRQVK